MLVPLSAVDGRIPQMMSTSGWISPARSERPKRRCGPRWRRWGTSRRQALSVAVSMVGRTGGNYVTSTSSCVRFRGLLESRTGMPHRLSLTRWEQILSP